MSDRQEQAGGAEARRFRDEEELGIACLAGWIGHPAVRPTIVAVAPPVAAAIASIEGHLDGQVDVPRPGGRSGAIGCRSCQQGQGGMA
jgi:hypothetical protein